MVAVVMVMVVVMELKMMTNGGDVSRDGDGRRGDRELVIAMVVMMRGWLWWW
jgi:hypothetical protein